MRIIIAPDKFKGSLNSFELCRHLEAAAQHSFPNAIVHSFPLADGGDGFASVVKHYLHTETITVDTTNAQGISINAGFEWDEQRATAYIELAAASGLAQLDPRTLRAMDASTAGTGTLVARAIDRGAKKIVLGAGGSATTDGGSGILTALGFMLLDKHENQLAGCGASLIDLHHIVPPEFIPEIEWVIAADVKNPLHGSEGAAQVFAAQKGADKEDIELLDKGLVNLAELIKHFYKKDISAVQGMGAAGGVAAALSAFFPVSIQSGADMLIEMSGLTKHLREADLLITGEGRFDAQSLDGKLVMNLAQRALREEVQVLVVCGEMNINQSLLNDWRIKAVALREAQLSREESMMRAAELTATLDLTRFY